MLIRFTLFLSTTDKNKCWNWCGSISGKYGELHGIGAHRISAGLFIGSNQGLNTLHKCDNQLCVNPFHLYYGTQKQNLQDAVTRGLLKNPKGWHHTDKAKAKISERSKGIRNPMYGIHMSGYWLGKHRSLETRKKIAESLRGKPGTLLGRTGNRHPWFGKHHTQESKLKISQGIKNYYHSRKR